MARPTRPGPKSGGARDYKHWTLDEDKTLTDAWPEYSPRGLARLLPGRRWPAIYRHAILDLKLPVRGQGLASRRELLRRFGISHLLFEQMVAWSGLPHRTFVGPGRRNKISRRGRPKVGDDYRFRHYDPDQAARVFALWCRLETPTHAANRLGDQPGTTTIRRMDFTAWLRELVPKRTAKRFDRLPSDVYDFVVAAVKLGLPIEVAQNHVDLILGEFQLALEAALKIELSIEELVEHTRIMQSADLTFG